VQSFPISSMNSITRATEKEAHIPSNSLLVSIRNPGIYAMEEAIISLESLLHYIRNSLQNAIEEESHITLESVLRFSGSSKGRPSFH
jgi:hypothetical protein